MILSHLSESFDVPTGHYQWRIQDFSEEGAPTPWEAQSYDFSKFSQNCMKLKEFGPPVGEARVPRAPLRSATDYTPLTETKSILNDA